MEKYEGIRHKEGSKKPMIAGILMIIVFLMAVYQASGFLFFDIGTLDIEEQVGQEVSEDLINTVINVCGVVVLIFGVFLLIGGVFAIKRIHWGVSLIGAILGIFTIGPLFGGSVLSLIALVLLFMCKDEFKGKGDKLQKDEQFDQFEKQTDF